MRASGGKWLEWGEKKVWHIHHTLTSQKRKEWFSEAASLPVILFKVQEFWGESTDPHTSAADHKQGFIWKLSLSSPVKNKNHLLPCSNYFSIPLKISTILKILLMTSRGFQGQPLLWGKALLWPCAVPDKLAELGETQWGLQQDFWG